WLGPSSAFASDRSTTPMATTATGGRITGVRMVSSSLREKSGRGDPRPGFGSAEPLMRSPQLVGDLLDLAGELEGQLVGEVHGGAGIRADVQPFAKRNLDRNGSYRAVPRATLAPFTVVGQSRLRSHGVLSLSSRHFCGV